MPNNGASLGKRIAGGLVDLFLSLLFLVIFGTIFGGSYMNGSKGGGFSFGVTGTPFVVGCVLVIGIFVFMEFKYGKSPGKFLCKTRVVSETGAPITINQSLARNFLRIIDGIFLYLIGLIVAAIDKNHQRLGDLVAKTLVIDETK